MFAPMASRVAGISLLFPAVVPLDMAKNRTCPGQVTSRAPSKAWCQSGAAASYRVMGTLRQNSSAAGREAKPNWRPYRVSAAR